MIKQDHSMRAAPDRSRGGATADLSLAAPLLLLAGACLAVVPWLHPNNTCKDWLMKWGQLAVHPFWLPIHQIAMVGFALAGAAAASLSFLGRRSPVGLLAGGMLAAGLSIQCMLVLIHATAVSRLGEAFNAATAESERQTFRVLAEAMVRYDVAASGVAAALLSAGAVLMAWHLSRVESLSSLAALFFAGLGAVWGLQAHGAFRLLHIPTTEWIPYTCLALWMGGLGLILLARRGEPVAKTVRDDHRSYEEPLPQKP
jgi:hypothetical protein